MKRTYDYMIIFKGLIRGQDQYAINKMDDDHVIASYTVTEYRNGKMTCTCPAGTMRHHCKKHPEMVQEFKRTGKNCIEA